MLFFKKDIYDLLEVIEEFYEENVNDINKLKNFVDYYSWEEDKILEFKKSEETVENFENSIEEFVRKNPLTTAWKIDRKSDFYMDFVIASLLVLNADLTVDGESLAYASTRHFGILKDSNASKFDYNNLLGFKTILGIPFLGVITKVNDKSIYQYFKYDKEEDKVCLVTPNKGLINDENFDIDSSLVIESIVEDFYGKDYVINLDEKEFLKLLNIFAENDFLEDIIRNFKENHF